MKTIFMYLSISILMILSLNAFAENIKQDSASINYELAGKFNNEVKINDPLLDYQKGDPVRFTSVYETDKLNPEKELDKIVKRFNIPINKSRFIDERNMIGFLNDSALILVQKKSGMFIYKDKTIKKYSGSKPITEKKALELARMVYFNKLGLDPKQMGSLHVDHMASSGLYDANRKTSEVIDNTVVFIGRQIDGIKVFGSFIRVYINNNGELYSCKGLWRKLKKANKKIYKTELIFGNKAVKKIAKELYPDNKVKDLSFKARLMYFEMPARLFQQFIVPVYVVKTLHEGYASLNFVNAGLNAEFLIDFRKIDSSFKKDVQSNIKNHLELKKRSTAYTVNNRRIPKI